MATMKKRNSYIFTNKRQSNRAIMATILGVITILSLLAVIYLTYVQKGNAPISYGLTGLLTMIMSLIGLVMGIITVLEKNYYKLFPTLGIVLNLISLTGVGFVVYFGMNG
ncbi:MAG: hypothetical protein IJ282_00330 [Lachnospiraceae bacterium]|nr:hypothetical protein [Lachnospiraceae bacterium]